MTRFPLAEMAVIQWVIALREEGKGEEGKKKGGRERKRKERKERKGRGREKEEMNGRTGKQWRNELTL